MRLGGAIPLVQLVKAGTDIAKKNAALALSNIAEIESNRVRCNLPIPYPLHVSPCPGSTILL